MEEFTSLLLTERVWPSRISRRGVAAYTSEGHGDRGTAYGEVAHCPMRKMTRDESWECRPRASGGREPRTANSASSGCLEVGLARRRRHPSTFAGSDIRSDGRSGEYKFIVSDHTLPNTKTPAAKTTQQGNSVKPSKRTPNGSTVNPT